MYCLFVCFDAAAVVVADALISGIDVFVACLCLHVINSLFRFQYQHFARLCMIISSNSRGWAIFGIIKRNMEREDGNVSVRIYRT